MNLPGLSARGCPTDIASRSTQAGETPWFGNEGAYTSSGQLSHLPSRLPTRRSLGNCCLLHAVQEEAVLCDHRRGHL